MNKLQCTKMTIIIIIFILGLYYVMNYSRSNIFETFDNNSSHRCPNLLFKKGNFYFLHNSKLAKVPGVNPIKFNNLEEYTEFIQWQKGQGISCPVLYLEYGYDTQGKEVYKSRTSPFDQENVLLPSGQFKGLHPGGVSDILDANQDYPPYNQDGQIAFDPQDQYIGLETPIDKKFHSKEQLSVNPMDPNWGGHSLTNKAVKSGEFKGDEVYKTQALV